MWKLPTAILVLVGASLYIAHAVLGALAAGILWAVLAFPLHRRIRLRLRATGSALVTLVATGLAFAGVAFLLTKLLLDDVRDLDLAETVVAGAPTWLRPTAESVAAFLATVTARFQREAVTALVQAPIVVFVAFWCLRDGWRIALAVGRALPLPTADSATLLADAASKTRAVARGQVLTAAIKGAVGGFGLWVAGVPDPVLLGAIMALFTLLPVLTAWMVWIPAALWLFSIGHTAAGLFLTVWGVCVVGLIDNVVRPILVGRHARMHPGVALVGMAGGALTLGLPGLVVGPVLLDTTLAVHARWRANQFDGSVPGPARGWTQGRIASAEPSLSGARAPAHTVNHGRRPGPLRRRLNPHADSPGEGFDAESQLPASSRGG